MRRMGGEMRVPAGGQNAYMPENLLNLEQINARLNQMRGLPVRCTQTGVTVAQAMRRNLFFIPQEATTLRMVACTPPRYPRAASRDVPSLPFSNGVVAVRLPFRPPLRLGNIKTGLWCTDQNRRSRSSVTSGSGTKRSLLPLASRI